MFGPFGRSHAFARPYSYCPMQSLTHTGRSAKKTITARVRRYCISPSNREGMVFDIKASSATVKPSP